MSDRDIRFDLLRVMSALGVVWLHVSAGALGSRPSAGSLDWWVCNTADAYSRWCVPIFVMVGGALLLAQTPEQDPLRFYRRRAARLLPALIFWTCFYIFWRSHRCAGFGVLAAAKSIVDGAPYHHMWYLYMLIGLYAVTPFLKQSISGRSSKFIAIMLAVVFSASSIETLLSQFRGFGSGSFLGMWLPFVGYFVAGYYLRVFPPARFSRALLLLTALICGALIALATGALAAPLGRMSWVIVYSYLNPLVIVMSLAIFLAVIRGGSDFSRQHNRWAALVHSVAPLTLGIYVIHPFWLDILNDKGFAAMAMRPLVGIPVVSLVVFLLSLTSSLVLGRIPLVARIVK